MPLRFPKNITGLPTGKEADRIINNGLTRIRKKFKVVTIRGMETQVAQGRLYPRRSGSGFTRFHRASARFQRPAIDTGNLIRNVVDRPISARTHEVYVDDGKVPYAKWLESPKFDRIIMGDDDIIEFESGAMVPEVDRMQEELFGR